MKRVLKESAERGFAQRVPKESLSKQVLEHNCSRELLKRVFSLHDSHTQWSGSSSVGAIGLCEHSPNPKAIRRGTTRWCYLMGVATCRVMCSAFPCFHGPLQSYPRCLSCKISILHPPQVDLSVQGQAPRPLCRPTRVRHRPGVVHVCVPAVDPRWGAVPL